MANTLIETLIKENCFEWQYGHLLYLTPPKNKRKIENFLMEQQVDYEEGQKSFMICEICKPTIPYLQFKSKKIGFSEKMYLFSSYIAEIDSKKIIDNAYAKLEQVNLREINISYLTKLRQAELKLFDLLEIELMICNECKTSEDKINDYMQDKLRIELREYADILEMNNETIITHKKTIIYYAPAKY